MALSACICSILSAAQKGERGSRSSVLQDNGDGIKPVCAVSNGADHSNKRLREDAEGKPQGQASMHTSNGMGAANNQHAEARAASAQHEHHFNGVRRPEGPRSAPSQQKAAAGKMQSSSGHNGQVHPAVTRQQSSAQDAIAELKRLKEKIALQEARMRREQVCSQDRRILLQHMLIRRSWEDVRAARLGRAALGTQTPVQTL